MNSLKNPNGNKFSCHFLVALGVIGTLIAILFIQSFDSEKTLFSNDGPLGAISSEPSKMPEGFFGAWSSLNWIGYPQPSASPNITSAWDLILKPLLFSKFYAPLALLLLGLSAWLLFRQLQLSLGASVIGGLAMALNSDPFSYACWGLPSLTLAMSGAVLALAALAGISEQPAWINWIRAALAGAAIGISIMEGFDNGAIFSLYIAAFALFQKWNTPAPVGKKISTGSAFVAVVAISAAVVSAHTLTTLIGTQIKGVAVMQQAPETKEERWNWATQWSLPKTETLRLIIPGLFGYRMDTPNGGNYWGAVGRDPRWEESTQREGLLPRHSGSGFYAGVMVVFVGLWAVYQSFQGQRSAFSIIQRRAIWFWSGAALISLLLAFGRHAPFYQFFYAVPFFSTIRMPIKFLHPLAISLVILFAYGVHGMLSRYLHAGRQPSSSIGAHLKSWWRTGPATDKKWSILSICTLAIAIVGWLVFSTSNRELERYLASVFFDSATAAAIADFSTKEAGIFVLFLGLSVGLVILVLAGWFNGRRARWAIAFLGVVLVADLVRANQPWIVYYNYKEKYASNPILDFLRTNPHEHRIAARLNALRGGHLAAGPLANLFVAVYENWLQHSFQYYNIQSLDIIQMPRMPAMDSTFLSAFMPQSSSQLARLSRLWQLTNMRYFMGIQNLGDASLVDFLNQNVDPGQRRFRVAREFAIQPRPGTPGTSPDDYTTVLSPSGPFAIAEFEGALPRAKLYTNWQVITNDMEVLQQLTSSAFDPSKTVLASQPLANTSGLPSGNQGEGSVKITEYAPKLVRLSSSASAPSVLLLNDRYDPNWKVFVDGKQESLLRLNFIMKGVYLAPGEHTIEFRFEPEITPFYISLAGLGGSAVLLILLVLGQRRKNSTERSTVPAVEPTPAT